MGGIGTGIKGSSSGSVVASVFSSVVSAVADSVVGCESTSNAAARLSVAPVGSGSGSSRIFVVVGVLVGVKTTVFVV